MTTQSQQQKEPTCTIKCPAIRDDKETWYCQIRRECVSPLEHHFEYGFDIVRCGKITHSGYSTPCNAIKLFRSRPAPVLQLAIEARDTLIKQLQEENTAIRNAERKRVLKLLNAQCFGKYTMNAIRCLECGFGMQCYDERESLRTTPQEMEK